MDVSKYRAKFPPKEHEEAVRMLLQGLDKDEIESNISTIQANASSRLNRNRNSPLTTSKQKSKQSIEDDEQQQLQSIKRKSSTVLGNENSKLNSRQNFERKQFDNEQKSRLEPKVISATSTRAFDAQKQISSNNQKGLSVRRVSSAAAAAAAAANLFDAPTSNPQQHRSEKMQQNNKRLTTSGEQQIVVQGGCSSSSVDSADPLASCSEDSEFALGQNIDNYATATNREQPQHSSDSSEVNCLNSDDCEGSASDSIQVSPKIVTKQNHHQQHYDRKRHHREEEKEDYLQPVKARMQSKATLTTATSESISINNFDHCSSTNESNSFALDDDYLNGNYEAIPNRTIAIQCDLKVSSVKRFDPLDLSTTTTVDSSSDLASMQVSSISSTRYGFYKLSPETMEERRQLARSISSRNIAARSPSDHNDDQEDDNEQQQRQQNVKKSNRSIRPKSANELRRHRSNSSSLSSLLDKKQEKEEEGEEEEEFVPVVNRPIKMKSQSVSSKSIELRDPNEGYDSELEIVKRRALAKKLLPIPSGKLINGSSERASEDETLSAITRSQVAEAAASPAGSRNRFVSRSSAYQNSSLPRRPRTAMSYISANKLRSDSSNAHHLRSAAAAAAEMISLQQGEEEEENNYKLASSRNRAMSQQVLNTNNNINNKHQLINQRKFNNFHTRDGKQIVGSASNKGSLLHQQQNSNSDGETLMAEQYRVPHREEIVLTGTKRLIPPSISSDNDDSTGQQKRVNQILLRRSATLRATGESSSLQAQQQQQQLQQLNAGEQFENYKNSNLSLRRKQSTLIEQQQQQQQQQRKLDRRATGGFSSERIGRRLVDDDNNDERTEVARVSTRLQDGRQQQVSDNVARQRDNDQRYQLDSLAPNNDFDEFGIESDVGSRSGNEQTAATMRKATMHSPIIQRANTLNRFISMRQSAAAAAHTDNLLAQPQLHTQLPGTAHCRRIVHTPVSVNAIKQEPGYEEEEYDYNAAEAQEQFRASRVDLRSKHNFNQIEGQQGRVSGRQILTESANEELGNEESLPEIRNWTNASLARTRLATSSNTSSRTKAAVAAAEFEQFESDDLCSSQYESNFNNNKDQKHKMLSRAQTRVNLNKSEDFPLDRQYEYQLNNTSSLSPSPSASELSFQFNSNAKVQTNLFNKTRGLRAEGNCIPSEEQLLDYRSQQRLNEIGLPDPSLSSPSARPPVVEASSSSSQLGIGGHKSNGFAGDQIRYATTERVPRPSITGRAMSQQSLTRPTMPLSRRLRRSGGASATIGGGGGGGSDVGGSSVSLISRLRDGSRYESAHTRTPVVMYIPQVSSSATTSRHNSINDLTSAAAAAAGGRGSIMRKSSRSRSMSKSRSLLGGFSSASANNGIGGGASGASARGERASRQGSDSETSSSMLRTLVKPRSRTMTKSSQNNTASASKVRRRSSSRGRGLAAAHASDDFDENYDAIGELATEIDSYKFTRRYSVPKDAKINWFAKLKQRVTSSSRN